MDEQACRLHAHRDLGELVRDGLELGQRPAERLAARGVRDGGVERGLRHADRERADARTEEIERLHRDAEALVDLAEHLFLPDGHVRRSSSRPDRMRGEERERLAREALRSRAGRRTPSPHARRRPPSSARRRCRRRLRARSRSRSSFPSGESRRRRGSARSASAAASEPASGSLSANAATASPAASLGTHASRTSGLRRAAGSGSRRGPGVRAPSRPRCTRGRALRGAGRARPPSPHPRSAARVRAALARPGRARAAG